VTVADLDRHLAPAKRAAVQQLIDAIRHSPEAIEAWIASASQRFPIIQDRGHETLDPDHSMNHVAQRPGSST